MLSEPFLKRVLMFIGFILSGLITLIFISTPESLQVPVPDSVPSITTKSSQNRELEEAVAYFGAPIRTQIPGASLAAIASWSPNGKYILTNVRFIDPSGSKTKPYIFDIAGKRYIEIPNAPWIDYVSWAGSKLAYQARDGYGYFDLTTMTAKTFGMSDAKVIAAREAEPIFSSDGSYIAFNKNGLAVYSTRAGTTTQLNNVVDDVPLLWKSDNKTLVIATDDGSTKNDSLKNAGEGNIPKKQNLATFHIGTKNKQFMVSLPQPMRRAQWVARDQLALFTLGSDDGFFDYSFDVTTNKLSLLAETSEGTAFSAIRDREIGILKANKLSLYDIHGNKKLDVKRIEKSEIANVSLLPSAALFVRVAPDGYEVAKFNIETAVETVLDTINLPYVVVAPNGKMAVTVAEESSGAQFIEIPNE